MAAMAAMAAMVAVVRVMAARGRAMAAVAMGRHRTCASASTQR
jgi:hypothetical protein